MRYESAPLDGVTTWLFRRTHREIFGGVDRYYTPFFSPVQEHVMTTRDIRELCPENNAGVSVVPQIMTRRAEDFLWAAERLEDMGYEEVDLNLGCPSGTVTGKGKGAGFLKRPEELDAFFDAVFSRVRLRVSVKTRLGFSETEEFPRLLAVYNRYPLSQLIVHPRLREDYYKKPLHPEWFDYALRESVNPVAYNGDLVTAGDLAAFSRKYPSVDTVMIGRGLVADPALLRKQRGGPAATREELQAFTRTLFEGYRAAYGRDDAATQRMKELWYFLIHLFQDDGRYTKKLRRLKLPSEYRQVEQALFGDLALLDEAQGAFQ